MLLGGARFLPYPSLHGWEDATYILYTSMYVLYTNTYMSSSTAYNIWDYDVQIQISRYFFQETFVYCSHLSRSQLSAVKMPDSILGRQDYCIVQYQWSTTSFLNHRTVPAVSIIARQDSPNPAHKYRYVNREVSKHLNLLTSCSTHTKYLRWEHKHCLQACSPNLNCSLYVKEQFGENKSTRLFSYGL